MKQEIEQLRRRSGAAHRKLQRNISAAGSNKRERGGRLRRQLRRQLGETRQLPGARLKMTQTVGRQRKVQLQRLSLVQRLLVLPWPQPRNGRRV